MKDTQNASNTGTNTNCKSSSYSAYALMRAYCDVHKSRLGVRPPCFFQSPEDFFESPQYVIFRGLSIWLTENGVPVTTGDKRHVQYVEFAIDSLMFSVGIPHPKHLMNRRLLQEFCKIQNHTQQPAPPPKRTKEELVELYRKVFDPVLCTNSQLKRIDLL